MTLVFCNLPCNAQAIDDIAMGVSFDITMGISNAFMGMLVLPLSELLKRLLKKSGRNISG